MIFCVIFVTNSVVFQGTWPWFSWFFAYFKEKCGLQSGIENAGCLTKAGESSKTAVGGFTVAGCCSHFLVILSKLLWVSIVFVISPFCYKSNRNDKKLLCPDSTKSSDKPPLLIKLVQKVIFRGTPSFLKQAELRNWDYFDGEVLSTTIKNVLYFEDSWVAGGKICAIFNSAFLSLWNGGMKDDFLSLINANPSYNVWVCQCKRNLDSTSVFLDNRSFKWGSNCRPLCVVYRLFEICSIFSIEAGHFRTTSHRKH